MDYRSTENAKEPYFMYELTLLIFAVAIIASFYLARDAYKHRFLPIAQPLMYFSIVLILLCMTSLLETLDIERQQWFGQLLQDIRNFFLRPLTVLFWSWTLLEYHQDKKIPLSNKLIFFVFLIPLLTGILYVMSLFSHGFISQLSTTALISTEERGGSFLLVLRVYGGIIALSVILLTPYVVRQRRQSQYPWLEALLVILMTLAPYSLYQLNRFGYFDAAFGAPAMIFLLLWGSSQYRLLDVLPVALQGVIDKVDSGILVSNISSKLLYINDYAQKLLNLNISINTLQKRDAAMPVMLSRYFDFGSPEKQTALIQTKNAEGEIRYIDAVLQPIFHLALNKHLGSTVSLHDITERKQAELELQNFNRQKSEFFAGVSHEFRTPLTLSMGGIDDVLAGTDPISPGQQATLLQAKNNNKRLLSLVNQLLELSRLDKGSLSIKPTKIRLDRYIPMLIANFESLAEKKNIRLHYLVSDEVKQEGTVYFDADALDKVLINLISNALKSITGSAGGDVYITLNATGNEQLQLTVRDTGCGIAVDAFPKIFEMFYSHQMSNTAWPPGIGVGLSLVKQLLLLHGGEISVSSIEGEGSCFTVSLRRGYTHFADNVLINHQDAWEQVEDSTESSHTGLLPENVADAEDIDVQNSEATDDLQGNTLGKHVLLAEDNSDMRRYIRKHLADYHLMEAADGEAALALAQQAQPDLVLSDVMMPKMNGYDLCKNLKSDTRTSHIPVVLLTAKSDQSEKLEGLSLGADDYISKPFDVKELNLRIHNLIHAKQTIHAFYEANGLEQVIQHPGLPRSETGFLETLREYALENIENAELRAADLAAVVHMSERNLSRKLKVLTGETPKKMLLTIRLEQAAKLLTESKENITSLGYQVGFSDASHFTRSFKTRYGMTPTEYRSRH